MSEWEGPIAEQLGLLTADVAAIKARHPGELKLQTYVIKTLSPVFSIILMCIQTRRGGKVPIIRIWLCNYNV